MTIQPTAVDKIRTAILDGRRWIASNRGKPVSCLMKSRELCGLVAAAVLLDAMDTIEAAGNVKWCTDMEKSVSLGLGGRAVVVSID